MSSTKSQSPCAVFDVVFHADTFEDWKEFGEYWKPYAKQWVVQLEKGHQTDYVHWQGRVSLIKKTRKGSLMKLMRDNGVEPPNYLEPTSNNAVGKGQSIYCMKADTRLEGPWTDAEFRKQDEIYIPRQMRGIKLRPWQVQVEDSMNHWDDRKVDIVIDTRGNSGKTTVALHCMLHHSAIRLPMHCDGVKLIQATCNQLMAKKERKPSHIFIDMPRALAKERLGGLFSAIEIIKAGPVYDERNVYKEWYYDSPRIWVFTNSVPDMNLLSDDRWNMWQLQGEEGEEYLVKYSHGLVSM